MNYLAHVFLSGDDDEVLLGNFIGDFVKGKQVEQFAPNVKKGILLHRLIDTFTDSHPIYLTSKRRFYSEFPKISGIITDILYDHLLCKQWSVHTELILHEFIPHAYSRLDKKVEEFPDKMTFVYEHMRENDWFSRYQTEEGTALSLMQIGQRIGFGKNVGDAVMLYKENESLFIEEFDGFFIELKRHVADFMKDYPNFD